MLKKIFKVNQNNTERVIRTLLGVLCFVPLFTHSDYSFPVYLAVVGAIALFNAFSGVCMIYKMFGYSSCPIDK